MATFTTNSEITYPAYDENYTYMYDYGDEYMYPGYTFERTVYLFLWEVLVIITFFQNVLILSVFMRRKMRNPTNIILSAIAISDSLSGIVTLPSYIMVFQKFDPLRVYYYDDAFANQTHHNLSIIGTLFTSNSNLNQSADYTNYTETYKEERTISPPLLTKSVYSVLENSSKTSPPMDYLQPTHPPLDGYILSKSLCRGFMISKYFLSRSFHTISLFLTLFLEIQRYVSMAFPYRYETCFNKLKVVTIYCISVFILCPFLHAFHLGSEKAVGGLCQWELPENGCGRDCIYLWIAFVARHLIPCVSLVTFTALFILQLKEGEKKFRSIDSMSAQYSRRVHENRRISFIVTAVVIVRMIPEIPYSILLLYNSIDVTVNMGNGIDLETNRIFHTCYEICLVSSFLANLYIYLIVNKSFRKHIYRTFIEPIRRHMRDSFRTELSSLSSSNRKFAKRKSGSVTPGEVLRMKTFQSDISEKMKRLDNDNQKLIRLS